MANPIFPTTQRGCFGELLVQLRLLQFDVQAAPPIKDSGNDLIAVRFNSFQSIQVKTTTADTFQLNLKKLPEFYHLLAVVYLVGENSNLRLDQSQVFLIPKSDVEKIPRQTSKLRDYRLCQELVDALFGERHHASYGRL